MICVARRNVVRFFIVSSYNVSSGIKCHIEKEEPCPQHEHITSCPVFILPLIFTAQTFVEVKLVWNLRNGYPIEHHLNDRKHNRGQ